MKFATLWRWCLIACLSVLMVACKPQASFLVTPNPATAGTAASFDASATLITSKSKTAASYRWDFGDGSSGNGQITTHVYAAAGGYTVTLTVTDGEGKVGTSTQALTVKAAASSTATLQVAVHGADGTVLPGATVSVQTHSAVSDATGVASVTDVPVGTEQVVSIRLAGYLPQVLRATVDAAEAKPRLLAVLLPMDETLSIADAGTAETVMASSQGATIALPANAFVTASGSAATGMLTAHVTPWHIGGNALKAMLGKGLARQADGTTVRLISAGILSADFQDASGNTLQLASGKTATVQVDLPYASVNGQVLAVGSTVPLWHFDEAQGLWLAEGSGTVVRSYSSPVGLALQASVSHFSTWSWSFGVPLPRSLTVYCADATGTHIACDVSAIVKLPDDSRFTTSTSVPASGLTVAAPDLMSVIWSANAAPDLVGQLVSTSLHTTVTIPMAAATSSNFVTCQLPDGTAVDCNVSVGLSGGISPNQTIFVPAGGALVRTAFASSGLSWQGFSRPYVNASGLTITSSGTTSSTVASAAVALTLSNDYDGRRKRLYLRCNETATLATGPATLSTCDIDAKYLADVALDPVHYLFTAVPAGTLVALNIPWQSHIFGGMYASFRVDATGVTTSGEAVRTRYTEYMSGTHYFPGNLTDGQVLGIDLLGLSIAGP